MLTGKPANTHNSVSTGAVAGSKAIDAGNKEQQKRLLHLIL